MNHPVAIVSASDSKYFPLLMGLIRSVHDQGWAARADILIIDVGMEQAQLAALAPLVSGVIPGRWEFDFPGRTKAPRWFQALVARPQLPSIFPGYDIYVGLDADAWLADGRAMELLVEGAAADGVAVVPELHAAYRCNYAGPTWAPPYVRKCYTLGWGNSAAAALGGAPILNAGIFAARGDYAVWGKWSERLRTGLKRTVHPLLEQCALNLALYGDRVAFGMLPAWCNWICHEATPRYNSALKRFEEPTRPFVPISIVHMCDYKFSPIKWTLPDGRTVEAGMGYAALKELDLI